MQMQKIITEGIEVIPKKKMEYRDTLLEEMDLEGIIKRQPALVLVDELVYTNVPGCLHVKRYQDVLELLAKGISVYPTLNVQHLENRAEVVKQITGITVRETVPDSIVDSATDIELIEAACLPVPRISPALRRPPRYIGRPMSTPHVVERNGVYSQKRSGRTMLVITCSVIASVCHGRRLKRSCISSKLK